VGRDTCWIGVPVSPDGSGLAVQNPVSTRLNSGPDTFKLWATGQVLSGGKVIPAGNTNSFPGREWFSWNRGRILSRRAEQQSVVGRGPRDPPGVGP
jgi:hypothetical protein